MHSARMYFKRVLGSAHLRAGVGALSRTLRRAPRATAIAAAALTCVTPSGAGAESTLERLAAAWSNVRDYSVTIDAHEVLDNRTEDRELHYAFRKPAQARLDLMAGKKSVARILWNGGSGVIAYRPGALSFLRIHGNAHGGNFTSLRGNGVLTPNFGDILACFEAHTDALEERPGPTVDGKPTEEIALRGTPVQCANDPPADKGVTLDVIDVSQRGEIVMRKRYEAAPLGVCRTCPANDDVRLRRSRNAMNCAKRNPLEDSRSACGPSRTSSVSGQPDTLLVESWHLRDYRINAGLNASDFH